MTYRTDGEPPLPESPGGGGGSTIYAAGSFGSIGGQSRHGLAALDAATGLATSWDPNPDTNVNVIAPSGSTVYVGGGFSTIGGQPRNRLAALDATTSQASPWNPDGNGGVNTLTLGATTVYAGGAFTSVEGTPQSYLAAIESQTTDVPPSGHGGPASLELTCAPNPFRSSTRIRFRWPAHATGCLRLFDARGRVVATPVSKETYGSGWHEAVVDSRGLSAGLYFCRLQAGNETRTAKVRCLK